MKAELPQAETQNARNLDGDKERVHATKLMAIKQTVNGFDAVRAVDVRYWMGRSSGASVVYCSIWVQFEGKYYAGHGKAGGYGYHKRSAALEGALRSAGFKLFQDSGEPAHIGGAGDSAAEEAIRAIGKAIGVEYGILVDN